jgi:hypothetical protein
MYQCTYLIIIPYVVLIYFKHFQTCSCTSKSNFSILTFVYFIPLNTLYFSACIDTRLVLISQHSLSTHSLSPHIYCFLFNTFLSSHPVLSLKPIVAFPSSYFHLKKIFYPLYSLFPCLCAGGSPPAYQTSLTVYAFYSYHVCTPCGGG